MSQLAGNQTTTTAPAAVTDQAISTEPQIQKNGSAVYLHQLTKRFGQNTVLKQCQLDIKAGEFIAIVGRSGCGKSTLLRLIANLDQATEGRVDVDSPEAWDAHTDIRVMFQEPRLLPWKSVLENVQLGLPKAKHAHAAALLATVGLEDKAKQWPSQLSGGQKQLVAIGRALINNPDVLLLDEPTAAMDSRTESLVMEIIQKQKRNRIILMVSHKVGHEKMADDVFYI
jgi:sulfonate transport system ATP-binding protein